MKQVTAALIGAGGRGMESYGPYAQMRPDELKFVAVADPDDGRRNKFAELHNIPESMRFRYDTDLLAQPKLADAVLICTQDRLHFNATIRAFELGYHVLLEKPMATTPWEVIQIGLQAEKYKRVCLIGHVLRYTEFFGRLKKLLDDGVIGRLVSVQHNENVAFWHQALSFVRGPWANSDESSPMILAKCCHDMDILSWLVGAECLSVASFGSLTHFRAENAPQGAPEFCQDGCPIENECAWHAPSFYLTSEHAEWAIGVAPDASYEEKMAALRKSNHGRCIYRCNNNVVDHQVVSMEFANEVTVAFTMCAFTKDCNRTIKLMGTRGEIRADMNKHEIQIADFVTGDVSLLNVSEEAANRYGHLGGDYFIMHDFVRLIQGEKPSKAVTSAAVSVQSHLMSFAAEKSRIEKKVIDLKSYAESLDK